MSIPTPRGDLTLGHILAAGGIALNEVVMLRHTYTVGGLETSADLTPDKILAYTRPQTVNNKLGKRRPPYWLLFSGNRDGYVLSGVGVSVKTPSTW